METRKIVRYSGDPEVDVLEIAFITGNAIAIRGFEGLFFVVQSEFTMNEPKKPLIYNFEIINQDQLPQPKGDQP